MRYERIKYSVLSLETTIFRLQFSVITTHYIEEAREANCIGFMRNGKLLAEAPPKVLLTAYSSTSLENVFLDLCVMNEKKAELNQQYLNTPNGGDSEIVACSNVSLDTLGDEVPNSVNVISSTHGSQADLVPSQHETVLPDLVSVKTKKSFQRTVCKPFLSFSSLYALIVKNVIKLGRSPSVSIHLVFCIQYIFIVSCLVTIFRY